MKTKCEGWVNKLWHEMDYNTAIKICYSSIFFEI